MFWCIIWQGLSFSKPCYVYWELIHLTSKLLHGWRSFNYEEGHVTTVWPVSGTQLIIRQYRMLHCQNNIITVTVWYDSLVDELLEPPVKLSTEPFTFAAPRVWNRLSPNITSANSLLTFQRLLNISYFNNHICWHLQPMVLNLQWLRHLGHC